MLLLDEKSMETVASPTEIVAAVKQALVLCERGQVFMPDRMHVDYNGNTLLLMPCFTENVFGTKVITLFPDNIRKNVPVLTGMMILNDGDTGQPLALLNGAKLTALRTGAVGAASTDLLTPGTVTTAGVIGAGVQGLHQALFAAAVRPLKRILVFDLIRGRAESLARNLQQRLASVGVETVETIRELVERSEVIITATNAEAPVLPDDLLLLKGKHIVAIGSYKPYMRELPPSLFSLTRRVFVDTEHALEESGDLIGPLEEGRLSRDQVTTLAKLLTGELATEPFITETTVFKCVGMAVLDLLTAELLYRTAKQQNLGIEVAL